MNDGIVRKAGFRSNDPLLGDMIDGFLDLGIVTKLKEAGINFEYTSTPDGYYQAFISYENGVGFTNTSDGKRVDNFDKFHNIICEVKKNIKTDENVKKLMENVFLSLFSHAIRYM
jgi:hypothetical protein